MFFLKMRDKYLRKHNTVEYFRRKGVRIGKNTSVAYSAKFDTEPYLVSIGDNCKITSDVRFVTHDGGVHVIRNLDSNCKNIDKCLPISIGNNVFIGNKATIMLGVNIGDNVVVGYGSIVTKDIPDNVVVAGIPARIICTIEEYKEKVLKISHNTKHMNYDEKMKYYMDVFDIKK